MNNPTMPKTLKAFVWLLLKSHRWALLSFAFVSIIWASEISLSPYLLKLIIDGVVNNANDSTHLFQVIWIPVVLYASMSMFINLTFRLYDYAVLIVIPKVKADIISMSFGYLGKHSHRYFSDHFAGNLSKKITDLVSGIEPVIQIPNTVIIPRVLSAIIASVMLYTVHPLFCYILIGWTIVYLVISYTTAKRTASHAYSLSETDNVLVGKIVDSVTNMSSIKLFANLKHEQQVIDKATQDYVHKERVLAKHMLQINFIQGLLVTLLVIMLLYGLIVGRQEGWVTVGDFALILNLAVVFTMNIYDTGLELIRLSKEVGRCQQALRIISEPYEIQDKPNAPELNVTQGKIEFQNVSFKYKSAKLVFDNKSVIIEPGQKVGLVGHSGSGKSTFINLILRLFDVTSGQILIDNQNISEVTQASLRRAIGMIPQEASLFHRTLIENIRFGRIDATDQDVIEAAKRAHVHEFVQHIPQGYNILVGERGVKLSGGQRQRIAIARAFLKNAPILILDEATSQLDSITEQYIQDSLWELMQGKTTIVVAHRLSTLLYMDRILVFDKGEIVQDGTHQELSTTPGAYQDLWDAQIGGFLLDDEENDESDDEEGGIYGEGIEGGGTELS